MKEGSYNVQVTVKGGLAATHIPSAVASYLVDSRVTGSEAVISTTSNPLVALYSVPPGPAGTVHVEFSIADANPSWRSTDERPSVPGQSTNFFVAGGVPKTTDQTRDSPSAVGRTWPLLFTPSCTPGGACFAFL